MQRRFFLAALGTGSATAALLAPAMTSARTPAESTRERPWLLRTDGTQPIPSVRCHIFDARTGVDVSHHISYRACHRLERSRLTGQPVRIAVLRVNADGKHYLVGERLASEPAWVRVIA